MKPRCSKTQGKWPLTQPLRGRGGKGTRCPDPQLPSLRSKLQGNCGTGRGIRVEEAAGDVGETELCETGPGRWALGTGPRVQPYREKQGQGKSPVFHCVPQLCEVRAGAMSDRALQEVEASDPQSLQTALSYGWMDEVLKVNASSKSTPDFLVRNLMCSLQTLRGRDVPGCAPSLTHSVPASLLGLGKAG